MATKTKRITKVEDGGNTRATGQSDTMIYFCASYKVPNTDVRQYTRKRPLLLLLFKRAQSC